MAISGAAIAGFAAEYGSTIAAVSAVAGTAATVYGQVEAGQQAKDAADYNARVADNTSAYELDAAQQRAAQIRKVGVIQQAQAAAGLAGSGVKIGEGSASDISRTIDQQTQLDVVNTMLTGQRNAKAGNDQADLLRIGGKNAESDSYIGAGSTILGSASRAATLGKGWVTTSVKAPLMGTYSTAGYVSQGTAGP